MTIKNLELIKEKPVIVLLGKYEYVKEILCALELNEFFDQTILPNPLTHYSDYEFELDETFNTIEHKTQYCIYVNRELGEAFHEVKNKKQHIIYTNSIEFLDVILNSKYDIDAIVTAKYNKDNDTIYTRLLDKENAKELRDEYEMELRC